MEAMGEDFKIVIEYKVEYKGNPCDFRSLTLKEAEKYIEKEIELRGKIWK